MTDEFTELVRSRRQELGLSYQALAAASVDPASGTKPSTGWLHRLETGLSVIPPSVELLDALAAGLHLTESRVREAAAAQFFGVRLSWGASGEAADLVAQLAKLPEQQRDAITDLIRVLAKGT
ncbi:helix-turn-helix transcriptional regulator [Streptomyces sp. KN37]|uniref:helix-turn-helix transcriptional regulator n=1 Tax=Streptomyces sp. KN37 TaxID=3090667 RepID=UPI002A75BED6|nr:helix-turn-helix transcriptional regulator [Streptomyces sp. KN37]WPO70182.1 helix-turn-helix transcriptional regulator [Streptomyces sp. KN37]WPO74047.1 helix-turn-helix transcriptional regulator [Streptomyces sp. KN37]